MANSSRLAEVVALLVERDQEFKPIETAVSQMDDETSEPLWSLAELMTVLQVKKTNKVKDALNRAKVAAAKNDMILADHFRDGSLYDADGDVLLSKYAAHLVVMNCDPGEGNIGLAQVYFALQVDRQHLEDEKRLKSRLDVATEQHKLTGVAKDRGVKNFAKFNGMGIKGLYGGFSADQVKTAKGLARKDNHLDYAGSEELAANLFRITLTRAALARQGHRSEALACNTHKRVGERVRQVIIDAGNTPPEKLPAADIKIDRVATHTKRRLAN